MKQRTTVMSGVQPSGDLHIGNWLGAIRRWVAAQDEWEGFFCVVDLHALTEPRHPALLHEKTLEVAAIYLACGLDPDRSRIFLQSHVPAHSELAWLLECFLPMGWLERMTQFKVRSRGDRERASVGLFNYPALMSADILLYRPELVPVGADQRQHLEVTRDVAQRINRRFGKLLTIPEAHVGLAGARIMGLDDPTAKMSKTAAAGAPNHAIAILDPPDAIHRKLGRAVTDRQSEVRPPLSAGVANLAEIYRAVEGMSEEAALELFQGRTYAHLKREVADALVAALEPVQLRYREIRDDEEALRSVLEAGASAAIEESGRTLSAIREAVGLVRRERARST